MRNGRASVVILRLFYSDFAYVHPFLAGQKIRKNGAIVMAQTIGQMLPGF